MRLYIAAIRCLLLLGLAFGSVRAQESGPITLRLRPKPNARYLTTAVDTMTIVGKMDGMPMTMGWKFGFASTSSVMSIAADGAVTIRTVIDSGEMHSTIEFNDARMSSVAYAPDSSRNRGVMAAELATELCGIVGKAVVSEYSLRDSLLSSNSDSVFASKFHKIMSLSSSNALLVYFPDHPVRTGDSWREQRDDQRGSTMTHRESRFTLRSIAAKTAEIDYFVNFTSKGDSSHFEGTYAGSCTVLRGEGMAVRGTADFTFTTLEMEKGEEKRLQIKGVAAFTTAMQ